jgi:hypothetical protein
MSYSKVMFCNVHYVNLASVRGCSFRYHRYSSGVQSLYIIEGCNLCRTYHQMLHDIALLSGMCHFECIRTLVSNSEVE